MHRLNRDRLYHLLFNIVACSRLKRHRSGSPVNASLESREGQEQLVKLLCDQLDNDSYMVLQAEFVSAKQRLGSWGVDEPVPATVPEPPKPRSQS